jgi:hypothetical protein
MANATGGLAYLLSGGRPPRRVQQAAGIAGGQNQFLGDVALLVCAPAVLITCIESAPSRCGDLYVEATKARG